MEGAYIALGLVALYVAFLFWLVTTKRLEKWNLGLMLGVVLMVRTQKGKKLIDSIARPKRFWNAFADAGTALSLLGMLGMTLVFFWTVYVTLQPNSPVEPLTAAEVLVIPGVNPFVPLWYGLIALIVTLVVHEGGHGVLARANNMRIKSLGLLVAVVPVGAFVEPEDLDLKVAPRRQRLRVFSAGPAVNLTFAFLCLVAFAGLLGAVAPKQGVQVIGVGEDTPAWQAGIRPGDVLVDLNGVATPGWEDYRSILANVSVGDPFTAHTDKGELRAGTVGDRWTALDASERDAVTSATEEGVATCKALYGEDAPTGGACAERMQATAFIGISPWLNDLVLDYLSNPFTRGLDGFLLLVSLPVNEVRGAPILSIILPAFHEAPFAPAVFWPLVTLLFWVFWINLMVGLTNILPMIPLDGGHIFRDAVGHVVERVRPSMATEARERVVGRTATVVSIVILAAFLIQILGPYIVRWIGLS